MIQNRAKPARDLLDAVARIVVDGDGAVVFADRVAADLYDTSEAELLGRAMADVAGAQWLGLPDDGPARDVVARDGLWAGHVAHRTRAGLLPVVVTARPVVHADGDGSPALHLTVAVEEEAVADGRIATVRSDVATVIGTARLPALLSLVGWLLAARTVEEVGGASCGTVVDTMGAVGGHLAVVGLDGSASFVTMVGYSAATRQRWGTIDLAVPTPIRTALVEGRAVFVSDRAQRNADFPALRDVDEPTQALCCVPLLLGGRVIGSLGFSFADARPFDAEERAFLAVVAHVTALSVGRTSGDSSHAGSGRPSPSTVLEYVWDDTVDLANMRAALRLQLEAAGLACEDALLCATELVTNAASHGAFPVRARFELRGDRLHIAVDDAQRRLPCLRAPGPDGGFGLRIVDAVSDRWGTAPAVRGKTTWAELHLSPAAAAAPRP